MTKRHVNPHPLRFNLLESDTTFELFAELPGDAPEAVDVEFLKGVLKLRLLLPLGSTRARWAPAAGLLWSARVEFGEQVAEGTDLRAIHEGGWLYVTLPKRHPGPERFAVRADGLLDD